MTSTTIEQPFAMTEAPAVLKAIRATFAGLNKISPTLEGWFAFNLLQTPLQKNKPNFKHKIMGEAEQLTIDYGEGTVAAYLWQNDGPTVVLAHGYQANAARFRHIVPRLLAEGYQVVAYDGPAHGNSSGRQTNPFRNAAALATIVQQYGPVHAVCGHSFGGLSTIIALHEYPELPIERVVLFAAPDRFETVTAWLGKMIGLSEAGRGEMHRLMEKKADAKTDHYTVAAFDGAMQLPCLVVQDKDDATVPFAAGEAIASAWPNATFLPTEGLGHRKILSDENVAQALIEFLGR